MTMENWPRDEVERAIRWWSGLQRPLVTRYQSEVVIPRLIERGKEILSERVRARVVITRKRKDGSQSVEPPAREDGVAPDGELRDP